MFPLNTTCTVASVPLLVQHLDSRWRQVLSLSLLSHALAAPTLCCWWWALCYLQAAHNGYRKDTYNLMSIKLVTDNCC